jgi:hypothetical protein
MVDHRVAILGITATALAIFITWHLGRIEPLKARLLEAHSSGEGADVLAAHQLLRDIRKRQWTTYIGVLTVFASLGWLTSHQMGWAVTRINGWPWIMGLALLFVLMSAWSILGELYGLEKEAYGRASLEKGLPAKAPEEVEDASD